MKDDKIQNGCGPWFLPDIIPDGPDDLFLSPCNEHDLLYNIGGSWKDKHNADFRLYRRSKLAVKNSYKNRPKRIIGYVWAFIYLVFVLLFGWLTFNFRRH